MVQWQSSHVWAMCCSYMSLYSTDMTRVIVYHTCYVVPAICISVNTSSWAACEQKLLALLRWLLFQGSVISYLGISTPKRIFSQTFRTQEADRTVAREVWSRAPVVYHPFPFANGSAAGRLADGTFFHWPLNWLWYIGKISTSRNPMQAFPLCLVYLLGQRSNWGRNFSAKTGE